MTNVYRWQKPPTPEEQCIASVTGHGRGVRFLPITSSRCKRKRIHGSNYCAQHAKKHDKVKR